MLKLVIETDEVSFSVHFFNEVMLACLTFYNSILFKFQKKCNSKPLQSRFKCFLDAIWVISVA